MAYRLTLSVVSRSARAETDLLFFLVTLAFLLTLATRGLPSGSRVLGVAVLEAGEAGRAARGAGAAPPAPPTALPGHGRGLDEAGVGLAVVSLEGVAAVLGRWRRHRGGHLGGSLLVLRNLLLQLAISIAIFRNKLEIFTTLNIRKLYIKKNQ